MLAGLSLERSTDPARFVEAFRGDDQLVVSYLSDELLAAMDDDDRHRSWRPRFSIGSPAPSSMRSPARPAGTVADHTADQNQLVVRLDNTGEWFRYHHLLRDLLALEAQRTFPERIPELHRRAAAWFESQHDHARASTPARGRRCRRAMRLMRVVGPDLLGKGQIRTLRTLLDQIGPAGATDTVCALLWGWCQYLTGRYAEASSGSTLRSPSRPTRSTP